MVVLWMPVLADLLTFVVDVGNWFVHKRHLQMQADAGAFAGAQESVHVPDDAAILQAAAEYCGRRVQRADRRHAGRARSSG